MRRQSAPAREALILSIVDKLQLVRHYTSMQRDLFEPLNDYYVTILRDRRYGFLAGPFPTHRQALDMVSAARQVAEEVDPWTVFDLFGTSSLKRGAGNPEGKLNERLGLTRKAGRLTT